ncbi:MAG: glycosyltransferase family 4 protein [Pirellulaceae bacterium]|nr:glycosyltransferase family 4 protein [Pirellulaceae bacterium]
MPLRLAILAPRFWPLAGPGPANVLRLAEQLRRVGCLPTVATPTWQRDWPRQIDVREVPTVRLAGMPRGGLRTLRYVYALSGWLSEQRGQFDAILAMSLRHEAYVALGAGLGVPVLLHVEPGEVAWQRTARFGGRIARRCQQAKTIVATSPLVERELLDAGYEAARIRVIEPGLSLPPVTSAAAREAAREALAAINHDLFAPSQHPVALAMARFYLDEGLGELIKAWRSISARWPAARLWIVGDGPEREALYQLIGDLDLRYKVLLPGTFLETEDLLAAADLFVRPALSDGNPLHLAEALAAGLPAVVTDLPSHRRYVEHERTGLLVSIGDTRGLTSAIARLIEHPGISIPLGTTARERVRAEFGLERWVAGYLAALGADHERG